MSSAFLGAREEVAYKKIFNVRINDLSKRNKR